MGRSVESITLVLSGLFWGCNLKCCRWQSSSCVENQVGVANEYGHNEMPQEKQGA
jgi:hypothetical protein